MIKNHKGEMVFVVQEAPGWEGQKLRELPKGSGPHDAHPTRSSAVLRPSVKDAEKGKSKNENPFLAMDSDTRKSIEDNLYLTYKQRLRDRFIQYLGPNDSESFLTALDL